MIILKILYTVLKITTNIRINMFCFSNPFSIVLRTIFKADFNMIFNSFKNQEENLPLILLKESTINERYVGYENTNSGWIFSKKRTSYISMGAFFISHKSIKERWLKKTSINFDPIAINKQSLGELMIDKDCFGEDPIQAVTLKNTIPLMVLL